MVIIRILSALIGSLLRVAAIGLNHLVLLIAALITTAAVVTLVITLSGTGAVELFRHRRKRKR